ncbi:MAG: GxxExxY protein [Kiritimatiellaeota bacterium]|nr:GxxExxY protein [Kiritimatiellota bacterium]
MENYKHSELTEKIIEAFYCVYNELGFGFLENVYHNALCFELSNRRFKVEPEKTIDVYYKTHRVGIYKADLIVNDVIIVEIKAVECLMQAHELQLINYLKATDKEVGLLLNFGKQPEIRRKAFDNGRKNLPREEKKS